MSETQETANAFFHAIEKGDLDKVASLYHDDIEVWHSHTSQVSRKTESLAVLQGLLAAGSPRYEVAELFVSGGRYAQRHVLVISGHNGTTVRLNVAIFLTIEHRKIHRIDEYFEGNMLEQIASL